MEVSSFAQTQCFMLYIAKAESLTRCQDWPDFRRFFDSEVSETVTLCLFSMLSEVYVGALSINWCG